MNTIDTLRDLINRSVIVRDYQSDSQNSFERSGWIFDFRSILLNPEHLLLVTEVLYRKIADLDNIQIAGMESAAIPLVTSLVLRAHADGKNVNGLYIRKSQKKTGLYKTIEGTINDNPVVIVDDLINSGSSVAKQILLLEQAGLTVTHVLGIVLFQSPAKYSFVNESLQLLSVFSLQEFNLSVKSSAKSTKLISKYQINWQYRPAQHSPFIVVQKSTPVINGNTIYFGAEDRVFRALDAATGALLWSYTCGRSTGGKSILSAACVHDEVVYFGSYDGRLQALCAKTGRVVWVKIMADSIGSSPVLAVEKNVLYIGLEFAGLSEHGGIAAVDLTTGAIKWKQRFPAFTHATPLYVAEHNQVFIGGNEGIVYALHADTGEIIWKFKTEGGQFYVAGGFSQGDIKLAPVYDRESDQLAVSSMDGHVYVLERASGALRYRTSPVNSDISVPIGIWAQPVFSDDYIIYAGLDKIVYCFDKMTGELIWRFETYGRIFATPVVKNTFVYIGSNDGCLYKLHLTTGACVARYQFWDRLVCPVVFDKDIDNQVYLLTGSTSLLSVTLD